MNLSVPGRALILPLLFLGAACGERAPRPSPFAAALEQRLATPPDYVGGDKEAWAGVRKAYEKNGGAPLWLDDASPRASVQALQAAIQESANDGLDVRRYEVSGLAELKPVRAKMFQRKRYEPGAAVDMDVRLTFAAARLARDLAKGRVAPGQVDKHWFGAARTPDVGTILHRAATGDPAAEMRKLVPRHPQYQALRQALAGLRAQAKGGAAATPASQEAGLPLPERIRRIEINLERWRWLPEDLGDPHILVNVPTYHLTAFEGGKPALQMRVVTGKPESPTPIFSDIMKTVVFSPYWNVPPSILKEEIVPALMRDPGYLYRQNMEVVRNNRPVDPYSADFDDPAVRVRQRPGTQNALGHVKFLFPNNFDVYLHDTPADSLFGRRERGFSHGCVRVEKPEELAQWVLKDQSDWTPERIRAAMFSGEERHVALGRDIPVYIVYQTVWVDDDGTVRYADDVYGHDARQERVIPVSPPPGAPPQRIARR
jgi:murein L,D-transpeptidase YcbB/YkuD